MSDSAGLSALSRRRLLAGLATIGGSMSAAGVGTWSLFSDDEQRTISVKAGTVSLSVDGSTDSTVTIDGITPNGGRKQLTLTNTGSLDADLVVCVVGYRTTANSDVTETGSVTGVRFNGCGTARVEFEDGATGSVVATVKYEDGESRRKTVSPGDTKLPHRNSIKIVSASVGGSVYQNDACTNNSASNNKNRGNKTKKSPGNSNNPGNKGGNSAGEGNEDEKKDDNSSSALTDALEIKIDLSDNDTLEEPLSQWCSPAELRGKCARAESSLPGGASTDLILDWKVNGKTADFAGQTVELDIKVSLQA